MTEIAAELARRGYALRGGVDEGGEIAFADGAALAGGECELILPWAGFNEATGFAVNKQVAYSRAVELAAYHHPAWGSLKGPVRKHMVAMVMKVLGIDLESPVRMVIAWAPSPKFDRQGLMHDAAGNIGVALRLAHERNIPCFHLDHHKHLQRINRLCGTNFALGDGVVRRTA